jgi:hypothetical protein
VLFIITETAFYKLKVLKAAKLLPIQRK